ncbi:MAG: hypothetical protein JW849_03780 [Phycisphaerae bacterium]|nr:hypothetical protein [Phycisphaerae bacterium]
MNELQRNQKSGVRSQKSEVRNPGYRLQRGRLPTTGDRLPATAFSLIELLVVISVIVLLVGILLPSILRAKALAYRATTKAYIMQLESGALRYQQEHQYFPGQENPSWLGTGATKYTGSQILAAAVFDLAPNGSGAFGNAPTSAYVDYKEDRVIHTNVNTPENPHDYPLYTPIDLFPGDEAQALLYYPSRLGNSGSYSTAPIAFDFGDNASYTGSDSGTQTAFNNIIHDTRFDPSGTLDQAYNSDTFLIFGQGLDNRGSSNPASWFDEQSPRNF